MIAPIIEDAVAAPREEDMLLFASYCGGDNPECSETRPCPTCLGMSNVFRVRFDGAVYARQLAPDWNTSPPVSEDTQRRLWWKDTEIKALKSKRKKERAKIKTLLAQREADKATIEEMRKALADLIPIAERNERGAATDAAARVLAKTGAK